MSEHQNLDPTETLGAFYRALNLDDLTAARALLDGPLRVMLTRHYWIESHTLFVKKGGQSLLVRRGRPFKEAEDLKSERLAAIRVTPAEKAWIQQMADESGVGVATYLRQCLGLGKA